MTPASPTTNAQPEAASEDPTAETAAPKAGKGKRLLLVGALLVALFVVGHVTGVTESVTVDNLRGWMAEAGAWGVLLFVAVFVIGELLHVPGLVFVAAAVLSYGRFGGGALGLLTGVLSVGFSFGVVRGVGGQAMSEIKWRWVQRILAKLEDHPIKTVVLLRVVLCLTPALTYALALSPIRFRDHLIGSAIGLIPPVILFVVFFDQAMLWLGV